MGFDRYSAKMQAKASMRGAYPHPMLVTLVFMLAAVGVPWVISYFVTRPFLPLVRLVEGAQGMDPDALLAAMAPYVQSIASNGLLFLALYFLVMLFLAVMSFGYVSYSLRLARGEQPSYRNLLDGFSAVGRVILTALLMIAFIFLWGLAGTLVEIGLIMLGSVLGESALELISVVSVFLLWAYYLWVFLRYSLSFHFLLDHPEMKPRQAVTASKRALRGHKWKLFVLYLSFIGWMLLVPFTLGVLYLWLIPYMMTSVGNFYDAITGGCPPRQAPDPLPGAGPEGGAPGEF